MDSLIQALYHLPAPERKRTKPMEVLALGMPRSGTESLSRALTMLGYDHTWHGFDPFDTPSDLEVLHDLAKLKWRGPMKGTSNVTAKDFDRLFGHSVAVTDLQPAAFARELILTYPDAKVILNYRQDEDAWYRSITAAFDSSLGSSLVRFATLFCAEAFWSYRAMLDYIVREVFHGSVHSNAKWVREEHHALIRGQCKDRQLLEWCVEDGWEPLCKFLDKPLPSEPFPSGNTTSDFAAKLDKVQADWKSKSLRNMGLFASTAIVLPACIWALDQGRR